MPKDAEQETYHETISTDESSAAQTNLFNTTTALSDPPDVAETSDPALPSTPIHLLTDQSSLFECIEPYKQDLLLKGKSNYTVTCFLSDLKMFSEHVGAGTPVGRLTKEQLTDWLMKLKFGNNGQVPAPKTMARRVTFLKNFFSWLTRDGVIYEDPSASLTLERPLPPLPQLLSPEDVASLLDAATEDARCQCLIYLVLFAGLKKEEVMGLRAQDVDLTDVHTPLVTVHFAASTGKQHRERRLALPVEFADIFKRYQEQYHPGDSVFACTDRNLNYILARAVKKLELQNA